MDPCSWLLGTSSQGAKLWDIEGRRLPGDFDHKVPEENAYPGKSQEVVVSNNIFGICRNTSEVIRSHVYEEVGCGPFGRI